MRRSGRARRARIEGEVADFGGKWGKVSELEGWVEGEARGDVERRYAPTASSSECLNGLISSLCSGSSHSVGSGSAGQCNSLRRLRGRSSSSLGFSAVDQRE